MNDSEIAAGEARLTLSHTAQGPKVDVFANGTMELTPGEFVNGQEVVVDVAAGPYDVTVTAPGNAGQVLAPIGDFVLAAAVNTVVHAVGSYTGGPSGTFTIVVHAIEGLGPDGAFSDDKDSVHQSNIDLIARPSWPVHFGIGR